MRIEKHPILTFEKGETVTFTYNGTVYSGFKGEPIASALHANGVRTLGHTHDKHRPRGLYCAIGNCSSCLATVNGKPNVRICVEPLTKGMVVTQQNGRGVLKND
ncbi:MAG: (2Fe-2S)-binding protein [Clostridia bacterium]|nr:(2Fe-2S)-binding protein [Clostridia bacterium]